ncbi:MAG: tRNA 4-thiouridine(8) synthase ThiI [Candidatus Omnitrophica bacterium]|nr:tRNA 4-thiouridine(8) synthase ThiI [Candidatus Omnitrophota bacterium]
MPHKAIALMSGGLDSLLAAKVMKEQGFEIIGVCFVMSFASRDIEKFKIGVQSSAAGLGISVRFVDISEEFLNVLLAPEHGYGAHLNPCIDCKIFMLRKASVIMKEENASVVVTGEVLNERPMSQRKDALDMVRKNSTLEGYLLRPLSAKFLEETIPEKKGIVKRELLLDIQGRTRRRQLELAEKYGINTFFQPAGGCLLTDPMFSQRLGELISHNELSQSNIKLLKFGRHFRLDERTKVIVGRDMLDNEGIMSLKGSGDVVMQIKDKNGPVVLLRGITDENNISKAAGLCVSHSKYRASEGEVVEYWQDVSSGEIRSAALPSEKVEASRI